MEIEFMLVTIGAKGYKNQIEFQAIMKEQCYTNNINLFSAIFDIISLFTWSKQKWLFWRPAFFQPIRAFWKLFRLFWLAE